MARLMWRFFVHPFRFVEPFKERVDARRSKIELALEKRIPCRAFKLKQENQDDEQDEAGALHARIQGGRGRHRRKIPAKPLILRGFRMSSNDSDIECGAGDRTRTGKPLGGGFSSHHVFRRLAARDGRAFVRWTMPSPSPRAAFARRAPP
jgi:hypothetical protein